ncbi:unnamed protein product, partial [Heterotrigona itama]
NVIVKVHIYALMCNVYMQYIYHTSLFWTMSVMHILTKNEWTSNECDFFADLTWLGEWKILLAKVKGYKERTFGCGSSRREGSPIPCVELYNKYENEEINVGQEMIKEGYAEPEETLSSAASSTLSLSTRSRHCDEIGIVPSPVPSPPKPTFSPETSVNTSHKSVSSIETPNASFTSIETSSTPCRASSTSVEEIDLITPQVSTSEFSFPIILFFFPFSIGVSCSFANKFGALQINFIRRFNLNGGLLF